MEKKKLFVEPEVEVVIFENNDVITTSGNSSLLPGGLVEGGEFIGH